MSINGELAGDHASQEGFNQARDAGSELSAGGLVFRCVRLDREGPLDAHDWPTLGDLESWAL